MIWPPISHLSDFNSHYILLYSKHSRNSGLLSIPWTFIPGMLLPWNIYQTAPSFQNVLLSHTSTCLFSHLFHVLVKCFHLWQACLDHSVSYCRLPCPQTHARSFPLCSTFFSYILITFEHSIWFTDFFCLLFMFSILSLKHKALKKFCSLTVQHWIQARGVLAPVPSPWRILLPPAVTQRHPKASF